MQLISSSQNAFYREIKMLFKTPAKQNHQAVLEGIHLCQMYLKHGGFPQHLIVSENALHHFEVAAIVEAVQGKKTAITILQDNLYQSISTVENGVGILFLITLDQQQAPQNQQTSCIALDRIQDPGNLGSILRSAAACGIKQVYLSKATVNAYSPKVLRAAMGAHFLLRIDQDVDLADCFKKITIPVIATLPKAKKSLYHAQLSKPVCWLFGHEGQGIAAYLLEYVTNQVYIPQSDQLDSINVAAAVAVCLFEQQRQNTAS